MAMVPREVVVGPPAAPAPSPTASLCARLRVRSSTKACETWLAMYASSSVRMAPKTLIFRSQNVRGHGIYVINRAVWGTRDEDIFMILLFQTYALVNTCYAPRASVGHEGGGWRTYA